MGRFVSVFMRCPVGSRHLAFFFALGIFSALTAFVVVVVLTGGPSTYTYTSVSGWWRHSGGRP